MLILNKFLVHIWFGKVLYMNDILSVEKKEKKRKNKSISYHHFLTSMFGLHHFKVHIYKKNLRNSLVLDQLLVFVYFFFQLEPDCQQKSAIRR